MFLEEMIEEERQAAAAKATKQATLETKKSMAKSFLQELSPAQVAKCMEMTVEELRALIGSTEDNPAVKKMQL